MKLKERLSELQGRNVKIGGGLCSASGFFYCGEVFDGIEDLFKEISRGEEARVAKLLEQAKGVWDSREQRWQYRVMNTENDLHTFERAVQRDREGIATEREWMARATALQGKIRDRKKSTFLKRFVQNRQKSINELLDLEKAHEVQRKRYESYLKTYRKPESRERQFNVWRNAYESYKREYESIGSLAELEVIEERGSLIEPGERIILVASSIRGPYWYREECERDNALQWEIRRARKDD